MAVRRGAQAGINVGEQVSFDTPVATTVTFPLLSTTLGETRPMRKRDGLANAGTGRNSRKHYTEKVEVGGNFGVLVTYEGFGILLKHLMGTVASGAGPPYTHTYTHAANLPVGLTLDVLRGTDDSEIFTGCKLNKGTLTVEPGKEVMASFDVVGRSSGGWTALGTATHTTSRDQVVSFLDAPSASWDGASLVVRKVAVSVDNKLATRHSVGSLYTLEPQPSESMDVLVSVDLEIVDTTLMTAWRAGTASDLVMTFTSGSLTFVITLNAAYIESFSAPVNTFGVLVQTLTFRSEADATGEGLTLAVTNTQASGVAA